MSKTGLKCISRRPVLSKCAVFIDKTGKRLGKVLLVESKEDNPILIARTSELLKTRQAVGFFFRWCYIFRCRLFGKETYLRSQEWSVKTDPPEKTYFYNIDGDMSVVNMAEQIANHDWYASSHRQFRIFMAEGYKYAIQVGSESPYYGQHHFLPFVEGDDIIQPEDKK